MDRCMVRVAPSLFLIPETPRDHSRKQIYKFLQGDTITLSHTRLIWAPTLPFQQPLIRGLSITYIKGLI